MSCSDAWLKLVLAEAIGPILGHRLLDRFGHPEAIFAASEEDLVSTPGLGRTRIASLFAECLGKSVRHEKRAMASSGVRLIPLDDPEYPALLKQLPHPPLALWVRGKLSQRDRLAVSIVGPRTPSAYGRLMTERLAGPLAARELTIVSGLAHGVDAMAHRAALESGGRTIAVLGQGLGTDVYPNFNQRLARQICEEDRGALISIFPMMTAARSGLFPQRNEIIAGMSLGTLIVEASPTSGTLITARHAAEAGRVVMACPGDASRRSAQGANRLIADGAVLIQRPQDVLHAVSTELRREMKAIGVHPEHENDGAESAPSHNEPDRAAEPFRDDGLTCHLLRFVREAPQTIDMIMEACGAEGYERGRIMERLLELEMDGRLIQLPGRVYAIAGEPGA